MEVFGGQPDRALDKIAEMARDMRFIGYSFSVLVNS
jgi:hypothetical protein